MSHATETLGQPGRAASEALVERPDDARDRRTSATPQGADAASDGAGGMMYHGGAPGFRVGDLIEPHPTKHIDDCAICAAEADENHLPDRVFATPVRLYAKHFASKWGMGWLYTVEADGEFVRSEADSLESYHAARLRVMAVLDRAVVLTMSERRRLNRLWTVADEAAGRHVDWLTDRKLRRLLGMSS